MNANGSSTVAKCIRDLLGKGLLQCGSNPGVSFTVSIDAESNVTGITATHPDAPQALHEAAQCLSGHLEEKGLRRLAARASEQGLTSFEYGPFNIYCDIPER